ncbi:MAG TPA: hypothetical protein DCZ97_01515 [Syntrophus sp. (in: bacteria)]|nr:MAG: hypothetical protein A2X92_03295 [Syntrophus sp. GWC2_56_31]HBB15725.1 hypothetical protein [Syntrophus sp. (in: bacteria)]
MIHPSGSTGSEIDEAGEINPLEKIKIDSVAVNILIPYPGTEFYRKFEREGRIIFQNGRFEGTS